MPHVDVTEKVLALISLRQDNSCRSVLDVFENSAAPESGDTWILQHGMAHNGLSFYHFVQACLSQSPWTNRVRRVVALNMPGRRGSEVPRGFKLGSLNLDDYAQALDQLIQFVRQKWGPIALIAGHSMGGMLLQMLGQQARQENSTFSEKYQIKDIILMGSILPRGLAWQMLDWRNGVLKGLPNVRWSFQNGLVASFNLDRWQYFFCRNYQDEISPVLRTLSATELQQYFNQDSAWAAFDTIDFAWGKQPLIDSKVFESERLFLLHFDQDTVVHKEESMSLYKYLSGSTSVDHFIEVPGQEVTHCAYIYYPEMVARYFYQLLQSRSVLQ